jgi:hypothetical protein
VQVGLFYCVLGVVGLFLNFSVVIFDKDKVVRTFRVIQFVRVATGVTLVKVTILHSNLHF